MTPGTYYQLLVINGESFLQSFTDDYLQQRMRFEAASKAGKSKTEAKSTAARANGAKGGRPRKQK